MGQETALDRLRRCIRHDWPTHFFLVFTNWLPDNGPFLRLRGMLVSPFLGSAGRNLRLARNVVIYNPACLHVGNDVYIAHGCWFGAITDIFIEDEVIFGPYCVVISSNHTRMNGSYRYGDVQVDAIKVKRGAWIAAHTVITAGSEIGSGTLVAANSVVVGKLPDHVLVAGSPAKVKRQHDPTESSDDGQQDRKCSDQTR